MRERTGDWLKLKCSREQELVIGGFTLPRGSRSHFGALLVGYDEGEELRYAGKVGTGFSERALAEPGVRLSGLETQPPPFAGGDLPHGARWSSHSSSGSSPSPSGLATDGFAILDKKGAFERGEELSVAGCMCT